MIHHQQVVGDGVEAVAVTAGARGLVVGGGAQFAIEHAVSQRLHRVDLGRRGGDANAEVAGAQFRERQS